MANRLRDNHPHFAVASVYILARLTRCRMDQLVIGPTASTSLCVGVSSPPPALLLPSHLSSR